MHLVAIMGQIEDVPVPDRDDDEGRFISEIESHALLPAHVTAATAAIVTMCTLAERLTTGQAYDLLVALPAQIQPLFDRCMRRKGRSVVKLAGAELLDRVAIRLDVTPAHAELICDCIFRSVRARLPGDVVEHVANQLPKSLSDLWCGTRHAVADAASVTETSARQQLLAEIADRAPLPAGITAPDAFSAAMCTFSRHLSGGEARDVFLGLPESVRRLLERCLVHRHEQAAVFDRAELVNSVADELDTAPAVAEQIVRVVLAAVKRLLPTKQVHDVASQLPPDLREIWRSA
ncbi:MAG: hypothetical protein JWO36_3008 [Myxococcales bacterium]|nr:hypothetical protein [Myxococcales bacterium]